MWHDMYRFHSLEGRKCRPNEDTQQYLSVPDMHQYEDLYQEGDEEKTGWVIKNFVIIFF